MSKTYTAVVGLDFPPDRRVEAGETVDDLPPKSVRWLLDQGLIVEGAPFEAPEGEGGDSE